METSAKETSTSGPKPTFTLGRSARFALGAVLVLVFLGSIGWIVLGWPLPVRLWIALVLAAGFSIFGFIALFVTKDLPPNLTRGLAGGTGVIVLIAAVMAVQGAGSPATSNGGQVPPATSGSEATAATPAPTESQPSDETDPFTATLGFNSISECENFTVPKSLLPSLPESDDGIDAQWIYDHGGATLSEAEITIQGKTDDAVVITRLRAVDVKREQPPPAAVGILPCGPSGGDMSPRSFEVNMKSTEPKIRLRRWPQDSPAPVGVDDKYLPIKVSNSDPEVFYFKVTGPDCFCEWRLAIDWTSRGRSGTTVVGQSFGPVKSDTAEYKERTLYSLSDGEWLKM